MIAFPRALVVLLLALAVGACSTRPGSDVLTPYVPAPHYTSKVDLLVATTRQHGTAEDPNAYGALMSEHVNFAEVNVSIPKSHVAGQIEWPDQTPADPLNNFVTTDRATLAREQFLDRIRAKVASGGPGAGSVLVFVHGYNTLYVEAVYRFAQIVHDSGYQGTPVLFAWPSRGQATLYLADRDASTYSRDYLEETLRQIAAVKGVQEVNILAHSMGTWLAVEALRQAKMKGDGQFGGKLSDVILASPDIGVGVFVTQLQTIGRLRRPMTILVSGDDKVLALSTALAGGVKRVGLVTADEARVVEQAGKFHLRVIDLTRVQNANGSNHAKFADSSAVLTALGHALAADNSAKHGGGNALVTAVTEVGNSLIKIPGAVIGVPTPQQ